MRNLFQVALDLLSPAPEQVPAPASMAPVVPTKRPALKKKPAAAPVNAALLAPDSVADASLPLVAPSGVSTALTQYSHPLATRSLQLGNVHVAYLFKRAKRRSIGFVVGPLGLVVSAPQWVPLAGVEAAVRDKGGWIVQKLSEAQERAAQQHATRILWQDGAAFPYLGAALTLQLVPGQRGSLRVDGVLQLGLPIDASADQIRTAVHKWLLAQARVLFAERLNHFAPQLGVQWTRLALSSAATRWGSASISGSIRLNWRLLHHPMDIIDYVVVHELSHLRFMDHSARFWDTVGSVLPQYPALRARLRTEVIPKWDH